LIGTWFLLACGGGEFSYPLDDVLRLDHVQAKGTHNSYHVKTSDSTLREWDYENGPLDYQAETLGIRQFELDIYRNDYDGVFEVYHFPMLDEKTNCLLLSDCLEALRSFSDPNPAHHPFLVLLEPKFSVEEGSTAQSVLDALESQVLSVWPEERLVRPDDVIGKAAGLREAVETNGWPYLGDLRGRGMFVLHTSGLLRRVYTQEDTTAAGRVFFPDAGGNLDLPYSAVHAMNDPIGSFDAIEEAVGSGHLVRTRADADLVEARASDTERRDAALDSGAHFVSTDVPEPREDLDYVVEIPGGTPSRCNPVTAPASCSSTAIEDPAFIGASLR